MSEFTLDGAELDDNDILCAFIITCPAEITEEQKALIVKQWTEVVLMPAVEAMQKFVLKLEIPSGDSRIGV